MLNARAVVVLASFIFVISIMLMTLSNKANYLCDVTKIDQCARTGGIER